MLERALAAMADGRSVLLVDSDDEHATGMLVLGASRVSVEGLSALWRLTQGWMYLALTDERCTELGLHFPAAWNDSVEPTALSAPIRARAGTIGGSIVEEAAETVRVAAGPSSGRDAIRYGGHIVPLRVRRGGVLQRTGHAEGAVDLARLAGLAPAAVLVEVLNTDGAPRRGAELAALAATRDIAVVRMGEIVSQRRRTERLVTRMAAVTLQTRSGVYRAVGYRSRLDGEEHMALVLGDVSGHRGVPVRFHVACWEGDVFASLACDCRERLDRALAIMQAEGCGVLVHLARPGAFHHAPRPNEEYLRDFGLGAQILVDLGVKSVSILTDHPRPLPGIEGYGLAIVEQRPLLGRDPGPRARQAA